MTIVGTSERRGMIKRFELELNWFECDGDVKSTPGSVFDITRSRTPRLLILPLLVLVRVLGLTSQIA